MPDKELRAKLWQKMLPQKWLDNNSNDLIEMAACTELSGGSITNVVRRCALSLIQSKKEKLEKSVLKEALQKEKSKT